ncbi:SDR family oxidoreductase [Bifidobacterium sp. DSM 109960]|uniref:SDR family oxidoreductase n=1 Tax=Bifidobacterium erythrocebi TaxID=2675325 RepID=A0A7Y0EV85_9BIFI|nr:SDR family oxidoreductase [Bifidobacterium sp. DSM 109960]
MRTQHYRRIVNVSPITAKHSGGQPYVIARAIAFLADPEFGFHQR